MPQDPAESDRPGDRPPGGGPDLTAGVPDAAKLAALDARIAKARGSQTPSRAHQEEHYSQAQVAWRMVIELVAGLGIGFGIGYGLDALFGTLPLFLVVFVLLGFAAGVKVMMRTATEVGLAKKAAQQNAALGRQDGSD